MGIDSMTHFLFFKIMEGIVLNEKHVSACFDELFC